MNDPQLKRALWSNTWLWLSLVALFVLLELWITYAVNNAAWLLIVPAWLALAYIMHAHLLALHECSHAGLLPFRTLNYLTGVLVGWGALMSFTLYRSTHYTHHGWLSQERDEELWPFVIRDIPRWKRRLAAIGELSVGLLYTPALFLRCYLRRGSPIRNRRTRIHIAFELTCLILFWTAILWATAEFALWVHLLSCYIVPAWLAGNIQSARKYVEHMGLFGTTAETLTRSIVSDTWFGRLVSFTLFDEPYHAAHHFHGEIPQRQVARTARVFEGACVYRTYSAALADVARQLADPKVGPQWLRIP
jgi:fatty acid desaturase